MPDADLVPCPACHVSVALVPIVADLTICPHCARTLVLEDDGSARPARQSDMTGDAGPALVGEALRAARVAIRHRGRT